MWYSTEILHYLILRIDGRIDGSFACLVDIGPETSLVAAQPGGDGIALVPRRAEICCPAK